MDTQGVAGEDGVEVPQGTHGTLAAEGESVGGGDRPPSYLPSVSINQEVFQILIFHYCVN